MLDKNILLFPNEKLNKKSEDVNIYNENIDEIIENLKETLLKNKAVGLSAPQIGIFKNIVCINIDNNISYFINPKIINLSNKMISFEEGCLSLPGVNAKINRPESCSIKFSDENNNFYEKEFNGIYARILQHEIDHLNGKLFISRMMSDERKKNKKNIENLKRFFKFINKQKIKSISNDKNI